MAKVKIYRYPDTGTMCLQVSNGNGKKARHSLPVTLTAAQWDGEKVTTAHKQRAEVQAYLSSILSEAQLALVRIKRNQATRFMSATQLRDLIIADIFKEEEPPQPVFFLDVFRTFADAHERKRTRELYNITLTRIREYDKNQLTFEQVDEDWLKGFDKWMAKRSPSTNARAIHLRNIRAVFNYAIDKKKTTAYPFGLHGFKIKREETLHRDLTIEDLRRLFSYQPPTVRKNKHHSKPLDYAVKYVDAARLIFYLVGINVVDLCALKPSDYYGGRIHYRRAKTGRLYDVKVEPEAAAILKKYKGEHLLLSMCEGCGDYKNFAKRLNKALRDISAELVLPPVTTYWLRHTWATLAYIEGASSDMVSDCLGHRHGSAVTATYINRSRVFLSKDEINRAVIDKLLEED